MKNMAFLARPLPTVFVYAMWRVATRVGRPSRVECHFDIVEGDFSVVYPRHLLLSNLPAQFAFLSSFLFESLLSQLLSATFISSNGVLAVRDIRLSVIFRSALAETVVRASRFPLQGI